VDVTLCHVWTVNRPRGIVSQKIGWTENLWSQHSTEQSNQLSVNSSMNRRGKIHWIIMTTVIMNMILKMNQDKLSSFIRYSFVVEGFSSSCPRNHVGCWSSAELSTRS
jgi:hypothetical protein